MEDNYKNKYLKYKKKYLELKKTDNTINLMIGGGLYEDFERMWKEHWFQYILNNPDKPWNYKGFSTNPNITWEIVQTNPTIPWNYDYLSMNPMTKAKNDFIRNKFREHLAREGIKEELMRKIMNPEFLGNTPDEIVERLKILGFFDEEEQDE